jgi:simple sugar transport system ATP-binding protein
LRTVSSGSVFLKREKISSNNFGRLANKGVAVIPEDRHDSGVVLGMSVADNLLFSNLEEGYRYGLLNKTRKDKRAKELIEKFEISCAGPDAPMWSLSGGNQQRVVLARETSDKPLVLIASQPTRGLDVGAIEYITGQLRDLAKSGVGVLLISSELDEILSLSDRVGVIFRGKLVASMDRENADRESLGLLMGRGEV